MSVYVEQKLSRACVVLVVFDMLTLNKTWLISLKTWQTCFIWKRSHIFCLFTIIKLTTWKGRSWPWLYGSLIYNYQYAISAYHHWCCAFESRSGRGVQHYMIKFVSDMRQAGGFLRVLRFPPPIKLIATI